MVDTRERFDAPPVVSDFIEIGELLARHMLLVLAATLLGLAVAVVGYLRGSAVYESVVTVRTGTINTGMKELVYGDQQAALELTSSNLVERIDERLRRQGARPFSVSSVEAVPGSAPGFLLIKVRSKRKGDAVRAVRAIAKQYVQDGNKVLEKKRKLILEQINEEKQLIASIQSSLEELKRVRAESTPPSLTEAYANGLIGEAVFLQAAATHEQRLGQLELMLSDFREFEVVTNDFKETEVRPSRLYVPIGVLGGFCLGALLAGLADLRSRRKAAG